MLSVANKAIMLNAILLNVVMLSVVAPFILSSKDFRLDNNFFDATLNRPPIIFHRSIKLEKKRFFEPNPSFKGAFTRTFLKCGFALRF